MPRGIDEEYEANENSRNLCPGIHIVLDNSECRDRDILYELGVLPKSVVMQLSFIIEVITSVSLSHPTAEYC